MSKKEKKPVRIRFKFNKETGQIEDFIIDDNAPEASESQHDKIAGLIASQLGVNPMIEDAGPRHTVAKQGEKVETQPESKEKDSDKGQTLEN